MRTRVLSVLKLLVKALKCKYILYFLTNKWEVLLKFLLRSPICERNGFVQYNFQLVKPAFATCTLEEHHQRQRHRFNQWHPLKICSPVKRFNLIQISTWINFLVMKQWSFLIWRFSTTFSFAFSSYSCRPGRNEDEEVNGDVDADDDTDGKGRG